ncbi:unnamed protein product [Adineta steineri]|uniref:Uncharacterized protein n=1 Tax=Adineta steineri TaxID=433720 RepID=A0A814BJN0_9BILA|nr:unnamed protein product [Adineta steineri]CAF0929364.1 unnamed protein product [Adineta steineri]
MKILFPDQKNSLISDSILLSNIRLDRIKQFGTKIKSGISLTEVKGELVDFEVNDRSHPRSKGIHAQSKHIPDTLTKYGYKYDPSWVNRPLRNDETIETALSGHSERLAIAYHFIQQKKHHFFKSQTIFVWAMNRIFPENNRQSNRD